MSKIILNTQYQINRVISFFDVCPKDVINTIYFEQWKDNIKRVHDEYYNNLVCNEYGLSMILNRVGKIMTVLLRFF